MGARRVRGEGSIYQRKDGRWVAAVDMGWVGVPPNRRRLRRTVTAATLRELRPKLKRLKAELAAGVLTDESTVGQWLDYWLTKVVEPSETKPSTIRSYRGLVENWLKPQIGHHRLDRLRPEHIRALYAAMAEAGRSDGTRHNAHSALHRALTVAVHDGRLASNPADRVAPPPASKGSHGKFTLAEAKQLLHALDGRPDAARWTCALLAGLRQGEALGLCWEDVDLDAGLIRVERAAQRVVGSGVQIVPLKSEASRRLVPMVEPVRFALAAMTPTDGYVFGTDRPTDSKDDWEAWRDLLIDVGLPHRPMHAARATTGSLLAEAKVHPKIIAEILGHASVQVTDRHYVHGDSVIHRDAMDAVAALVSG
jgi:integrase